MSTRYSAFITVSDTPLSEPVNVAFKVDGFKLNGVEEDVAALVAAEQALIDASNGDEGKLPAFINGYVQGEDLSSDITRLSLFDLLTDESFASAQALNATSAQQRQALKDAVDAADMPVADFSITPTGLQIAVDSAASTVDEDATVRSVTWKWGDGSSDGSGATANRTYASGGTYLVTCIVEDSNGLKHAKTKSVTVT